MSEMPKRRVSSILPVLAPIGGIDDSSPLANMGQQFAIEMTNWFPTGGSLRVRPGYREHVTGLPADCRTIMSYRPGDPTGDKLFACTDAGIYDITAPTDTPVLAHAITNGDIRWTQFSNIAGTWLIGCNGVDPAFLYNGTAWIDFVTDGAPSSPGEIAGLAPENIIGVLSHKNRIWFIEKDTLVAWYWPLNAIAGTATAFPLGGVAQLGGRLNAIFTWTMDGAYSVDDMMVFQTSVGELLAYGGTDPASVSTWALIARYYTGAPMSDRCHKALNGDMMLMTEFGLVSLAKVVAGQQSVGALELTTSYRISEGLNAIIQVRSGSAGWEVTYSPSMQYLILSIPDFLGGPAFQYVMNAVTGAWTTFNLPAETFLEFDGLLYFADTDGRVLLHGDTTADEVKLDGTGAVPIIASFKQAYSYFESPNASKHFKLIRPVFESSSVPAYTYAASVDYSPMTTADLQTPGVGAVTTATWDSAEWDVDEWAPPAISYQVWQGLTGVGYSASLLLKISTTTGARYVASQWAFETGVSL